ncbi:hypothetical protein [Azohydromonas caseinilytica]|uniref:Uncharacterized protein n=1 Tax=Azohydromonas caseinilytica TaxID=2728836 RepID=A0A848F9J4_9BURK|nr:hypothetical protein [Azohydromonas caseinilytica]NML16827.1 hypothetical protein [Azohydromonas caseinilytica]
MALIPMRGALIEYGGQFLGPIPNIVLFQFNPETISRTIRIPQPPGAEQSVALRPRREIAATEAPPVEEFSLTAHFSAHDDLGAGGAVGAVPRLFGVGPQLAALEKMVYPPATPGGLLGAAIDAIGDVLGGGGSAATQPVPRVSLPRLLFIWGPSRVLPVRIRSLTIAEKQYDMLLNPIEAEVQIGLTVAPDPPAKTDPVGHGAFTYSQMVKDTQATLNLAKVVEFAVDLIPF